jgi:hopanoid biosynthesis associated RND transporter like protein HpnN
MKPEQLPPGEANLVARILVALVAAVCRHPRTVLAVSLLLCAVSAVAAATRLQYHTSRNDLISPRKDYQQRWSNYLKEFGDDDDIVAVVKGKDRARMKAALEEVAAKVSEQPELFDRLFYKVDLRALRNRALLFLSADEIAAIDRNVRGMGPLLEPTPDFTRWLPGKRDPRGDGVPLSWKVLSLHTLLIEARSRVEGHPAGEPLSADDAQFFTQLAAVTHAARETLIEPVYYHNPWGSLVTRPTPQRDLLAEPTYFFNEDPQADPRTLDPNAEVLAFLLVRPIKEKGSFTAAQTSVNGMRDILAQARGDYPELEFGLTGMPVLETDEMAAAGHDTNVASWLAIGCVTLLFLCVYRSIYYPALTVVTLLVGTLWALGWLTLTVGHLNILSATFAVMLIGMGDYGVLWVMRYEQARRHGMDVRGALLHTTRHVAVGNLTAASTLALAFFAAIFADFKAVAELGWIAGCGVLLCAFACFTVLPSLLTLLDKRSLPTRSAELGVRNEDGSRPATLWFSRSALRAPSSALEEWLPILSRRPAVVVGAGLFVTAVLALCACRVRYDHNLLHLQAKNLDSVKWEMVLIEKTAGASWHAVSYTDTPEQALALKEKFEQLPEVSRVVEVATLVPADQDRKLPLLADMRKRLAHLPPRGAPIPHMKPNIAGVQEALAALVRDMPAHAPADGPSAKLMGELHRRLTDLHAQLAHMPTRQLAEERLQQFDERLAGDLAEDLHRLREVCHPAPITVADLPAGLRERYVGQSGKWLLRVFAKDCLWDFEPLEHFALQIRKVDPTATGKPFGTVEGLKAMKDGLERAGFYALLVIVAVLFLDFRSLRRTLFALTPLGMGVVLTLGIMGLFDVPLNPANMIAFPLILGVGVDNGVHVLHDYLLRRGERRTTISYAIGRGVLVKALTTMIGFGTLMISTERGLVGLGLILTLGVGCSMLTALIFLPAMLSLLGQYEAEAEPRPEAKVEAPPLRVAA